MIKKLTSLFIAIAFFCPVFANTFIVTSNADSGPGSLREAMILANSNGISITDSILFNLPDISLSGRKIVLRSALPAFTSNITIDASTQPGTKFGLSDARVELYVEYDAGLTQKIFTIIDCSDIKIYALKIDNKITWTAWYPDNFCFYIEKSDRIEIGNVGKGNVIINWTYAIRGFSPLETTCNDINIFSNFLGLNEDGETAEYNEELIVVAGINNINIGSLNPLQGNVMACSRKRIEIARTNGLILVANNKIGTNYKGTVALSMPYGESSHYFDNILIANSNWYNEIEYLTDIKVINNLSAGICRSGIYLLGYGKKFYIQGNKIGTDITGTKRLNLYMDYGVRIENCRSGIIGVENDEAKEKNIIAFAIQGSASETYLAGTGVSVINCEKGITISRNSIFCDQKWGIGIGSGGVYEAPVVTINKITASGISGTAPPLSRIELFRDDSCVNCEGKIFFDSALADNNGQWVKNNINTANIVATATDTAKMTSEFSSAKYLLRDFLVKQASCGKNNGSITGIQIVSGTHWQWEDINGAVVGTDSVLTNIGPGSYRLVIGIGYNSCTTATDYYLIGNNDLPQTVDPTITPASCGQANGTILINFDSNNFGAIWLNSVGDSTGIGGSLDNALPGSYYMKLTVWADTSCNKIFGPITVPNGSGASIVTTNAQIIPATCNNVNGGIKGITATNVTGTPFIQWVDSLDKPVGADYDLLNVPAGKYRFIFKDVGSCDTIRTSFYSITVDGDISIDTSGKLVTPSQCKAFTGSIQEIKVTGADNFQWTSIPDNKVEGINLDIFGLPSGNYQLTATNNFGCSKTSGTIAIPLYSFTPITPIDYVIRYSLCGMDNGKITISVFNGDSTKYSFHWVDSSLGKTVGIGTSLANLPAATYQLFAKDVNGCEQKIFSANTTPPNSPAINYSRVDIKNDECSLHKGSISPEVTGLQGPTSYTWYDKNNAVVGNTAALKNVGAGTYILKINDAGVCTIESTP
ncbi:MAG: hypothetical protein ABIQ31_05740, partial [Ferruginibacter sp.]